MKARPGGEGASVSLRALPSWLTAERALVRIPRETASGRSVHTGRSVPANTCHASADFANKLRSMYTRSP